MDEFVEFYAASRDRVFRTMVAAIGNRSDAEEAVAEAYARAYASWRRVRAHPNPAGWVVVTALNSHRAWWRRRRREGPGEPPDTAAAAPPDEPGLPADLRRLVLALPRRQREVIALRLVALGDTVVLTAPNGSTYRYGRLPAGTRSLTAGFSDGSTAAADLGDGVFVYLTPPHATMARLIAHGDYGTSVLGADLGPLPTLDPAGACATRVANVLAHAPGLTAAQRQAAHPTVGVLDRPGGVGATVLEGDDRIAAVCAGSTRVWFPDEPFSTQPRTLSDIAPGFAATTDGAAGFVFGHAPAGAQRVDVVMSDGSTHPTVLGAGGFYSAYWLTGPDQVARIVAVAADSVYTLAHGRMTVAPR